jgi:hypothetical protein
VTAFLTALLSSIIRPIIQAELEKLKAHISELFHENQKFKEFDKEVDVYMPMLANASTSEERWALVQDLKNKRARLNAK